MVVVFLEMVKEKVEALVELLKFGGLNGDGGGRR